MFINFRNSINLFWMRYRKTVFVALFIFSICTAANSESITYSITSEKQFWKKKQLISEGILNYSSSDVIIEMYEGVTFKYLPVSNGFNLGISVERKPTINGFGLWINKDGEGFSWEWFARKKETIFCKIQENGCVLVTFKKIRDLQEVEAIEFLHDISLRLNTLDNIPFWSKETHRMLIKKGSRFQIKKSMGSDSIDF